MLKVICYQIEFGKSFADVSTEYSSRNIGKLFSKLKLVTDNLLFIYAEATECTKERLSFTNLSLEST